MEIETHLSPNTKQYVGIKIIILFGKRRVSCSFRHLQSLNANDTGRTLTEVLAWLTAVLMG